jgi:ankyrin repeat protein
VVLVKQLLAAGGSPASVPVDRYGDVQIGSHIKYIGIAGAVAAAAGSNNTSMCSLLLDHLEAVLKQSTSHYGPGDLRANCASRALRAAARNGHCDMCSFLCDYMTQAVEHGNNAAHDRHQWDREVMFTLKEAASNGDSRACALLLKRVPQIHYLLLQDTITTVTEAGHLAVIQLLAAACTDPRNRNINVSRNPLFTAAKAGHLHIVRFFLEQGASLDNKRGTPWFGSVDYPSCAVAAAAGGNIEVLQLVLDASGPLDWHWHEAVAAAAAEGHWDAVHLLLKVGLQKKPGRHKGAKKGQQSRSQQASDTSLALAAAGGHTEVLRLLLEHGQLVGKACQTYALIMAAEGGQLDTMRLLLQHEADANDGAPSFKPTGPLARALAAEQTEAAQLLLSSGAHTGFPALMWAVRKDMGASICKLLLHHGAHDSDSHEATYTAALLGQHEVVQLLLQSGQQQGSSDVKADGWQAALCGAAAAHNLQLVKSLLSAQHVGPEDTQTSDTICADQACDADVSSNSGPASRGSSRTTGRTAHRVPASASTSALNRALDAAILGSDYKWQASAEESRDAAGVAGINVGSPESASTPCLEVVKLLLQQGAEVDYGEGMPLWLATFRGSGALVQVLLDGGAVHTRDAVLHAAQHGYAGILERLLSGAGDLGSDTVSIAALQAAEKRYTAVMQLLLEHKPSAFSGALQLAVQHCRIEAATALLKQHGVPTDEELEQQLQAMAHEHAKTKKGEALLEALGMRT